MTTRITGLVMVLAAVALAATGCERQDTSLERIEESGTLRVGLDPTYPPFELADDTGVSGLDVDLAHELAAGLGVEPAFSYFGYDGLYDALLTDQVDVLISALVISPERTRDFAYSRPYYDAGQVLVVAQDSSITGTADLPGQTVAVELGALGHVDALALERSVPNLTVQTHGSAADALLAVVNDEADAALVDSISARLFRRDAADDGRLLLLLPDFVSLEPFAVVVRIEDEAFLQEIDSELSRMAADGRLEQLVGRWVGP